MTAGGVAAALLLAAGPTPAVAAGAVGARSARAPVRGLDISAYQHIGRRINWAMLRRDGLQFVAIKVSEGTYYSNPYYLSDARGAAGAGLNILPYVFANPSRSAGAVTASFAVRAARYQRRPSTLPLAVDLENDPYRRGNCYGLRPARMIAWIAGFITRARKLTGKWPVIYTTDDWWQECTRSAGRFRPDPLWLAAYDSARPSVPSPWHAWAFWQYADDGFLPGIGLTDLDYFQPVGGLSSLHPEPRAKHKKARPKKHRKHKSRKHQAHKAHKAHRHKARRHKHKVRARKHKARRHTARARKHRSGKR